MLKKIYILILTGLLITDCHIKDVAPGESDMAATIAGNYNVTFCQYLSGATNVCDGSATISRIDANTIQADYTLSSGNPFREKCSVKKIANDTIVRGGSGFGQYRNGVLYMQFADSTLTVHFGREEQL